MRGNITKLKGSVFFLKKMEYDSSLGIKNGWDPKKFRKVLSKLLKLFFLSLFQSFGYFKHFIPKYTSVCFFRKRTLVN